MRLSDSRAKKSMDLIPVWHVFPVKPSKQEQVNVLAPSKHVAELIQGLLSHLLSSREKQNGSTLDFPDYFEN